MIDLKINRFKYKISFLHGSIVNDPGQRFTEARMYRPLRGKLIPIRKAAALCHPRDNFNRRTGRKVALKHLIAHLPKEDRAQVWAQYFTALPQDKAA